MVRFVLYALALVCVGATPLAYSSSSWRSFIHRAKHRAARKEDNSMFVSVFSARMNVARRNMTRNLWVRRSDDFKRKSVMSIAVCKFPPASGEDPWVEELLQGEAQVFKDIDFLDCHEGQEYGQMREKAVLAMESYRNDPKNNQLLFLHIEDDTFVPWNRLIAVLDTLGDLSHFMMGEMIPEGKPVNRDKLSPFYQPEDIYAPSTYPKHLVRHGMLFGRELVKDIIDSNITHRMPLTNMDQAFGVWAAELESKGKFVDFMPFDPPSKNADGIPIKYSACGDLWSRYPFLWQHGLNFQNMQCLGDFDVDDTDSKTLDSCLTDCYAVR